MSYLQSFNVRIVYDGAPPSDPKVFSFDPGRTVNELRLNLLETLKENRSQFTNVDEADVSLERNGNVLKLDLPLNSELHNGPVLPSDVIDIHIIRRIRLSFRIRKGIKEPVEFSVDVGVETTLQKDPRMTAKLIEVRNKYRFWGRKVKRFKIHLENTLQPLNLRVKSLEPYSEKTIELVPVVWFEWPPRLPLPWPPPPVTTFLILLLAMLMFAAVLWPRKTYSHYTAKYRAVQYDFTAENRARGDEIFVDTQSEKAIGLDTGLNLIQILPKLAPIYTDSINVPFIRLHWLQRFGKDTIWLSDSSYALGETVYFNKAPRSFGDPGILNIIFDYLAGSKPLPKPLVLTINGHQDTVLLGRLEWGKSYERPLPAGTYFIQPFVVGRENFRLSGLQILLNAEPMADTTSTFRLKSKEELQKQGNGNNTTKITFDFSNVNF